MPIPLKLGRILLIRKRAPPHNQPHRLPRLPHRARRPQLDLHLHDLRRRQPLPPPMQMDWQALRASRAVELAVRRPQPPERRGRLGLLRRVPEAHLGAVGGDFLQREEEVGIGVGEGLDVEPGGRVAGDFGARREGVGEGDGGVGVVGGVAGEGGGLCGGVLRREGVGWAEVEGCECGVWGGEGGCGAAGGSFEAGADVEGYWWPGVDLVGFVFEEAVEERLLLEHVCVVVVFCPFFARLGLYVSVGLEGGGDVSTNVDEKVLLCGREVVPCADCASQVQSKAGPASD